MSCILAIDDRPINRQFLVSLLGYGGHTVLDPKTNEKRALDAGAEAFFQKPVDNEEPQLRPSPDSSQREGNKVD